MAGVSIEGTRDPAQALIVWTRPESEQNDRDYIMATFSGPVAIPPSLGLLSTVGPADQAGGLRNRILDIIVTRTAP